MLTLLSIKDFTLIKNLEIEFNSGFTVLTGETGAGKSILLDAITLALGGRGDPHWIRHGCDRCEIIASFTIEDLPFVKEWLQIHELESDNECIIRRILNHDGRTRGMINGTNVPIQSLKELGQILLHIHGQHEQYALFKREYLRLLLDRYANHSDLLKTVQQDFYAWQQIQREINTLQTDNDTQKIEFLQFQVQELQRLSLTLDELTSLEQSHKRLSNIGQLQEYYQRAIICLREGEETNVFKLLHQAQQAITLALPVESRLKNVIDLLANAEIHCQEALNEIEDHLQQLDLDPSALQKVEQRLSDIYQIARKYRVKANEIPALLQSLQSELDSLQHADQRKNILQEKLLKAAQVYQQSAAILTNSRQNTALKLSQSVTQYMRKLGMTGGQFQIHITPIEHFSAQGVDQVEFLVTANPGQPLQALHKVASGGELARINLAIQVVTAQRGNTPSLIFDEVDVGIGGGVAEIVGKLMRDIGNKAQVLSVTHLPQVAAKGHHHLQVTKQQIKKETLINVTYLSESEKIQELARMLGGLKITAQTLAHAREMLTAD